MGFLQGLSYVAVAVFVVTILVKIIRYANLSLHLRWELYPVAHEEHAEYGGSYYEKFEWWTHPFKKNRIKELMAMFKEIVLLKGVYEHNRSLWKISFPFHFGLYLLCGFLGLLLAGAILQVSGILESLFKLVAVVTIPVGILGMVLTAVGAAGLFFRRMSHPGMRKYTAPVDYFNLVFILAIVACGLLAWVTVDSTFDIARGYVAGLITFSGGATTGIWVKLEILLLSVFMIYMPFTYMTHFFAKYFTYHQVRWNDEPNLRGGVLEKKIMNALNYGVAWSAPHIQTGKKWSEVATEMKNE